MKIEYKHQINMATWPLNLETGLQAQTAMTHTRKIATRARRCARVNDITDGN